MAKNYMLNKDTGKLHIVGYCHHTTGMLPYLIEYFDTEDEAYLHFGREVRPCDLCQIEKEKRMEEAK